MATSRSETLLINPDVAREDAQSLRDIARSLPGNSLWSLRSAVRGKTSPTTGRVVQLEVCYLHNNRLGTSMPAYYRYIDRINGVLSDGTDS